MAARRPTDWEGRARRAEAHLAALDRAVAGIAGVLELDRVLQLIVDQVRELGSARYAALGAVGASGDIELFLTSGLGEDERARIGPPPRGRGLLGALIAEGRTIRLRRAAEDPRFSGVPPGHFLVTSFLGVPVRIGGRSVGNLYLANKRGAEEFSATDQDLVERFARHAAIAIDNARLHDQLRHLAVVEERDRIGRDLHDGVTQRLYAVTLSLDDVPELMDEAPAEARDRVEHAIGSLQDAIGEIRTFVYELRPSLPAAGDLRRALAALVREAELAGRTRISLVADEGAVDGELAGELVSVAREALSNIGRHAGAEQASVRLERDRDRLRLSVWDDGRGFRSDRPRGSRHHGLANMRERVAALGGRFQLETEPGRGTHIIVEVPVHHHRPSGAQP